MAIQGRILEELPMVAVEVGTASSRKGSQLVAIGIDANGVKRVLGIQPGSGADREAVEALAADLYRRGLNAANGNSLLLITEGTEAEETAFLSRWPRSMRVAHCQKAMMEKVLAHLGVDSQEHVRKELQEAFGIADAARALVRLEALEQRLRSRWPGAAASLSRHAAASLTVKNLGVGGLLERSISTLSVLRTAVEQARIWGHEAQGVGSADPLPLGAVLWEQRTRRVIGYEEMPRLVDGLAQAGLERTA
ncbi:MAG: transposase [Candidatus Dormibacteria bacterium]